MKKTANVWLKYLLAAGLGATIATGGQYIFSSMAKKEELNNLIQYVSEETHKGNQHDQKTPEEISLEEGIDAEQIVVKVTDDGYVTSHGDHFHYYSGKVPFDAIISEELLLQDSTYQLKEEDIQYELADGYMLKINGQYVVYVKNRSIAKNIRTKDDIKEQRERMVNGFRENHNIVTNSTEKGEKRYTTDDGYVFTVDSIVQDVGEAFICRHGNHFHYILKTDLSVKELQEANYYLYGTTNAKSDGNRSQINPKVTNIANVAQITEKTIQPLSQIQEKSQLKEKVEKDFQQLLQELYQLPLEQRHVEEDGLVFDPMQVTTKNAFGYVIPHGDHFHIVPASQLSTLEVQLANMILAKKEIRGTVASESVIKNQQHSTSGDEVVVPPKAEKLTPDNEITEQDKEDKQVVQDKLSKLNEQGNSGKSDKLEVSPASEGDEFDQMIERVMTALQITEDEFYQYAVPIAQKYNTTIDQMKINQEGNITIKTATGTVVIHLITGKVLGEMSEGFNRTPNMPTPSLSKETEKTILDTLHAVVPLYTEKIGSNGKPSKKGGDGQPYETSDGYIFTPESVFQIDED